MPKAFEKVERQKTFLVLPSVATAKLKKKNTHSMILAYKNKNTPLLPISSLILFWQFHFLGVFILHSWRTLKTFAHFSKQQHQHLALSHSSYSLKTVGDVQGKDGSVDFFFSHVIHFQSSPRFNHTLSNQKKKKMAMKRKSESCQLLFPFPWWPPS